MDRFEFVLGYEEAKNYPMETFKFNSKYCDIFAGPMPHKIEGITGSNSMIAKIQNNQSQYPKLTRLISAGVLKITKNSFEQALQSSRLMNFIDN